VRKTKHYDKKQKYLKRGKIKMIGKYVVLEIKFSMS
jgi:hypothetical protein